MTAPQLGSLTWLPAADHPDLLAPPSAGAALTRRARRGWPQIDDDLADTAAFTDAYAVPAEASANCVVVAARRAGQTTLAACVVLATTRADVNGLVRRHLGARKASFAPQDVAVAETGMAYGGITPVGLPAAGRCSSTPPSPPPASSSSARAPAAASSPCPVRRSPRCPPRRCSTGSASRCRRSRCRPRAVRPRPLRRAPDDSDVGWGERPPDPDEDDRRYLEDRPPHWGSD